MIINLTPHNVKIVVFPCPDDSGTFNFQPSGKVARVAQTLLSTGFLGAIPTFRANFGQVEDLPDEVEGVALIVSAMVRCACPDRGDLFSPGDLLRDEKGMVIGCKGLIGN